MLNHVWQYNLCVYWLCLLKFWIRVQSTRSNSWTAQLPRPSQDPVENREHVKDDGGEELDNYEDDAGRKYGEDGEHKNA